MDWISFNEQKPENGQRCLVCYKFREEVIVLTYNKRFECWDDEEGDDFYCDFSNVDFWMPLPNYINCD